MPSTIHNKIKFGTRFGSTTIFADTSHKRTCHEIMLASELISAPKKFKADHPLEKHVIHDEHHEQAINIGVDQLAETKVQLVALLTHFVGVFAWQPANMNEVGRTIIKHSLNILTDSALVKQKRRGQTSDRNKTINDEVVKLVNIGILREAMFPTWIESPIMVKKHDGSW